MNITDQPCLLYNLFPFKLLKESEMKRAEISSAQ